MWNNSGNIGLSLLARGSRRFYLWSSKVPSNPIHSMTLWSYDSVKIPLKTQTLGFLNSPFPLPVANFLIAFFCKITSQCRYVQQGSAGTFVPALLPLLDVLGRLLLFWLCEWYLWHRILLVPHCPGEGKRSHANRLSCWVCKSEWKCCSWNSQALQCN